MAKSKFEYVKAFETHCILVPNTFVVVRIDGHGFHRFTSSHLFQKPNDFSGLLLANSAAKKVMEEYPDIILSYGQSDEYSFILKKNSTLFKRREAKIISNLVSLFSSCYVMKWKEFFQIDLLYPPSFDARSVIYPDAKNLKDYLAWRQADCHINNLYNTAFWALVKNQGISESEAQLVLKDTDSAAKNELLFSKFSINYAKEPEIFRKGTLLYRKSMPVTVTKDSKVITRVKSCIVQEHVDIIGQDFWINNPTLLETLH